MSISGQHAVVTGASRGIGLAIAQQLAREGARVSVVSRSAPPAGSGPFFHAPADVTDESQVEDALRACRQANGSIAVLVNNAGIVESAPLGRTTLAMWDRILATNLTGTFLCMRAVLAEMIEAGGGRIVNVASTAGLAGAPYIAAYCASKHGVIGLTRAVAAECDGTGVTVNAICPGYTETDILRRAVANIAARTGRSEQATRELLAANNPEGRFASVAEIAQGVVDLVNGSRSGVALIVPGFAIV